MINSAKEAKEIIALWKDPNADEIQKMLERFGEKEMSSWPSLVIRAEEYLAALKGPEVKVLMEAAEKVISHYEFIHRGIPISTGVFLMGKLDEDLKIFRKSVNPEEGGIRF